MGRSLYCRMPCRRSEAAASRTASCTSPTDTSLPSLQNRSTTEPSGTGTLAAIPCRRPASSGSTTPTALAAPVEVGMMFSAAARLRRQSECGTSARRWSLV